MGSWCLMETEFQSWEIKRVLENGCTTVHTTKLYAYKWLRW